MSNSNSTRTRITRRLRFSVCVTLALTLAGARAPEDASPWKPLPSNHVARIAFGSCAKHWQHQPIWEGVVADDPDLFLFLGDAIYADTDGKGAWDVTEPMLRGEWNRIADKPEFQRARAAFPFLATWDNHDYGTHSGGAEFALREESKRAFLDFFGEPQDSARRKHSGVYDAKVLGQEGKRVQIILLDTRFNRGLTVKGKLTKTEAAEQKIVGKYAPNTDPAATLLGPEQWNWLEEQLKVPADVRLLCSSTQVIPDEKAMDEWSNFPLERTRLLKLITETEANGVILLSGNVHFAEISRLEGETAYPLVEFTSSGMTHINEYYATCRNRYRTRGPYVDLNFGLIELDWEMRTVTLSARDKAGKSVFEQTLAIDDLR